MTDLPRFWRGYPLGCFLGALILLGIVLLGLAAVRSAMLLVRVGSA